MPLIHYEVDLSQLSASERNDAIGHIETRVETHLAAAGKTGLFTFFLDEKINPESVIPSGVPAPRRIQ